MADMKTSTNVGEMVGDFGNTKFMLGRWWGTPSKWQMPRDVGKKPEKGREPRDVGRRGRGNLGGC